MERKRFFFAKGYVHITNSKQRKHLSPSARCAPVNGLAGCYVATIGKPHEYFDLTGTQVLNSFVFLDTTGRLSHSVNDRVASVHDGIAGEVDAHLSIALSFHRR